MADYPGIGSVPQSGMPPASVPLLASMIESLELLTGQRRGDITRKAIAKGDITIRELGALSLTQVRSQGRGHVIQGVRVADADDYALTVGDVQAIANDLSVIRDLLNELLRQMKRP